MAAKSSKLSQLLKSGRISSGLSQTEVAHRLGYKTAQFVSNWERGIVAPPGKTLRKLANIFDLSHAEIYDALLEYALERAELAVRKDFYGSAKRAR
jgi:transcriptional regulator with XRE-family HTH domain